MYTPLLNLLLKGVRAELLQQAQDAASNPNRISSRAMTMISSNTRLENYGWLGQAPGLIDITSSPLVVSPMSETLYALSNKTFGAAVGISRDDLADDQINGFLMRARGLNNNAVYLGDQIGFNLLINGDVANRRVA